METATTICKRERADHLFSRHTYSLDRELAPTHVEQILEVWTEKVDDKHIVQTLLPKVMDLRDAGYMQLKRQRISDIFSNRVPRK